MEWIKIEFKNDPGFRDNKLKKYGTVFQYLIGSDGFDPSSKEDRRELIDQLDDFMKIGNEKDLDYQLSKISKELKGIQNLKIE